MTKAHIHHGKCLAVLGKLEDNSVDSVVTDPPYALSFMGKDWDTAHPDQKVWRECQRVLKPGGHLLSFGGTRTWHRLCCDIEDSGFEIRDSIAWLYGSGFPKSLDVSKAIDKAMGVESTDIGSSPNWRESKRDREKNGQMEVRGVNAGRITIPVTDAAKQWQGWGTALKPAFEPIIVARKPLTGTVATNIQEYGTGALNIDVCRVAGQAKAFGNGTARSGGIMGNSVERGRWEPKQTGRWPTNVVLDGDMADELDEQSGNRPGAHTVNHQTDSQNNIYGKRHTVLQTVEGYGDSGGASRFFPVFRYQAKAPTSERYTVNGKGHPTVKPLALMRWLVKLVTPLGGMVLDPFAGTGTTGEAAILEGMNCILIEKESEYIELIKRRMNGYGRRKR